MKKLILILMSMMLVNIAHAGNPPTLRLKIAGSNKNNTYFLCVANLGCVSLYEGAEGKKYPMDAGKVYYIFTANAKNFRMYTQPLPSSCKVNLSNNQTLVVSGKLVRGVNNGNAYIDNLACSVKKAG